MRKVTLSDVCDISSGGTPSRNNPEYFKGNIPWAKISDIENAKSGIVYTTDEHISSEGLKNIRGKLFPKGTLLFAMYGSIGKVGIAGKELSANQAILGIRPKRDGEIDLNYLKSWFGSNKQKLINQGRGVALKNLSATIVRNLEILLPPLNDQIRIAHLLGKVEGLIAQRKQHLQQLDDLLKSVFLAMFGDPVRNEKGWDKPELKAFGKISTGNTPPRNDPANYDSVFIEWIKTDNITGNAVFVTPSNEHLSEVGARKARTVTSGALLVACIAGSVESIGRAALTDRTVSFNQQINAIKPGKDVNPLYLYGLFKLSRAYIQSHATKGMKKILTKGDFEQITMIKPPLDFQNQFAVIVKKVEGIKSRYQQSLTDLEVLYGALSQKAFKGELDLSRVLLSATSIEGEHTVASAPLLAQDTAQVIDLPDTDLLLPALEDQAILKPLLHLWLEAYRDQLGSSTFSVERFMAAAQTRLTELYPDNDFELGTDAYEHIKTWVFDQIGARNLKQTRDIVCVDKKRQFGNKLLLRARKLLQQ